MDVVLDRTSPYRGADVPRARRFTRILWALGCLIVGAVLPFYPPTNTVGGAGWWFAAAGLAVGVAAFLFVSRRNVSFGGLLAVTYVGLALVTGFQLLAGAGAPYLVIDLLLVCSVALTHPFAIAMPYAAIMVASRLAIALVHDPGTIVATVAESLIWTILAVVLCGLMRQVREQRLELHHERSRDALTGLLNRRSYDERLDSEIAAHHDSASSLSLIVADVNGFKQLNDSHGHLEGDRHLTLVAAAIASAVRPTDVCFRWGGDEFAVLLPGADERAATQVANRLRAAVAEACVDPMPLSVGVGHSTLIDGDDADALTARADLMLMEGKRARRAATVPAERAGSSAG